NRKITRSPRLSGVEVGVFARMQVRKVLSLFSAALFLSPASRVECRVSLQPHSVQLFSPCTPPMPLRSSFFPGPEVFLSVDRKIRLQVAPRWIAKPRLP